MKWIKWLIGLGLVCNVSPAAADESNNGGFCGCCPEDMNYSLYVDYLYWQVCRQDLDIGGGSREHYLTPDYDHAFRVGGGVSCDCWDLQLRYTYFDTEQRSGHETEAWGYDLDLDMLDIELGYTLALECADFCFRPFAGAKLAWVDERFARTDITTSWQTIEFEGYGLYLGANGRWGWCCSEICGTSTSIGFVFRGSIGVLEGEFDNDTDSNQRGKECLLVPIAELFVGLEFGLCDIGCMESVTLTVGYEVQSWFGWREIGDDDDMGSLGFGGSVFRVAANF